MEVAFRPRFHQPQGLGHFQYVTSTPEGCKLLVDLRPYNSIRIVGAFHKYLQFVLMRDTRNPKTFDRIDKINRI